ncbi:polyserase-2-like [Uranotaenia lowii]|uniref:polyserase-2-like n=1 Tax=Uranotaenia lowii TaxID=190385 RepID=UPI002479CAE8|nr:polyserase-2-like [Uranotaenia lowii]
MMQSVRFLSPVIILALLGVTTTLLVEVFALDASEIQASNSLYQCGVRRRFGIQLIHHSWPVELGQWPWHVGLHHLDPKSGKPVYKCGGTLLDDRHVLTSAHCVSHRNGRPLRPSILRTFLGQYDLLNPEEHVQVMNVSELHVHPEFEINRNDVAILVLNSSVRYSDFILPVCLNNQPESDILTVVGQRGSVTGWGKTDKGSLSRMLRTAQMPIVDYVQCVQNDPILFGRFAHPGMFCAGELNGTSVCSGDSGGGLFLSEGDRWVLRGVVSFSGQDKSGSCDTLRFVGFANVDYYIPWIRNVTKQESGDSAKFVKPKRKSEIECDRYKELARKRSNGACYNSRRTHTVGVYYEGNVQRCTGILVSEKFVLVPCHCAKVPDLPVEKVRIGDYNEINVSKAACHPESTYFNHDLALLELESAVKLSSSILPACLANSWSENLYDTLLLTGFTSMDEKREFIESAENRVVAKDNCNKLPFFQRIKTSINDTVICSISTDVERKSGGNYGSSGSALQSVNTRTCMHTVVGMLFAGTEAGSNETELVDLFSRISSDLDWMESIIWGSGLSTDQTPTTTAIPLTKPNKVVPLARPRVRFLHKFAYNLAGNASTTPEPNEANLDGTVSAWQDHRLTD